MIGRPTLAPALAIALLACGCSSGGSPPPDANEQEARAGTAARTAAPVNAAAASEDFTAPESPARPASVAAAATGERRCGWLINPTPANWWLTDRDGQWILGTQGADQAPGMDEMPDMSTAGWVETNGHYGYGCACMTITTDGEGRVTRIADAQPKPLKQCQADRALPKPE